MLFHIKPLLFVEYNDNNNNNNNNNNFIKGSIWVESAELLERNVNNKAKRLFLEAMHSEKDANAVNEHVPFPIAYRPLLDCMN